MARKASTRARTEGKADSGRSCGRLVPVADIVGERTGTRTASHNPISSAVVQTLIVLPTYQEAANIADVLRRVRAASPGAHVLVVDDGSPDGTADLAAAVRSEEHTSELQSRFDLVCRLLPEKKKSNSIICIYQ